ncbi:hypothetical protein EV121DRAFT_255334 [Schizophyllum commune]
MASTQRLLLLSALVAGAYAHGHHHELSDADIHKPIDAILWIHIFLQAAIWGVLFPTGMVLGLSKSRWHVPLQATGIALTLGGYILGHAHKGRAFLAGAHGKFANILLIPILTQLCLGIYLKLHIHEKSLRPYAVKVHGLVGKTYPILGWTQMLFGAITFRGYCRGGHLGQCLAHYIMGSGFIAYGTIMAIILLVGESWVRRSGRSPEWWDSWVIMLWGIVNTFTEHHGGDWSVKDMQHTILGVLWWAGGMLGIFLARNNQRNVVPALIIILTGWAMANHAQALMISTEVHSMFGHTLFGAGLARIIEIAVFAPNYAAPEGAITDADDAHSDHTLTTSDSSSRTLAARAFRHLPPYLLTAAGILFMSGTDEELKVANDAGMDHVTYILIMFSLSFVIYTLIVFLINLYATSGRNAPNAAGAKGVDEGGIELSSPTGIRNNWYSRVPNAADAPEREPIAHHVIGDDED